MGKLLVPVARKVRVTVVLETLGRIWLEPEANAPCCLEVHDQANDCLAMLLARIVRILGDLMDGKENVGASRLGQVVILPTAERNPNELSKAGEF